VQHKNSAAPFFGRAIVEYVVSLVGLLSQLHLIEYINQRDHIFYNCTSKKVAVVVVVEVVVVVKRGVAG
jgi:hypothetical protein